MAALAAPPVERIGPNAQHNRTGHMRLYNNEYARLCLTSCGSPTPENRLLISHQHPGDSGVNV